MAYQKLNTSRAYTVTPSDDAPIPEIMVTDGSGTVGAVNGNTISDNTQNFRTMGVKRGMVVVNTTSGASAIVESIVVAGNSSLVLNAAIFAVGDTYQIYGGQNNGAVLYVGKGGDLRVLTAGNDDVVFAGVPDGSFIPVNCIKVFATDTTADNILALW